jgi:hypothetical protein
LEARIKPVCGSYKRNRELEVTPYGIRGMYSNTFPEPKMIREG